VRPLFIFNNLTWTSTQYKLTLCKHKKKRNYYCLNIMNAYTNMKENSSHEVINFQEKCGTLSKKNKRTNVTWIPRKVWHHFKRERRWESGSLNTLSIAEAEVIYIWDLESVKISEYNVNNTFIATFHFETLTSGLLIKRTRKNTTNQRICEPPMRMYNKSRKI